jgi:hypothetical protein
MIGLGISAIVFGLFLIFGGIQLIRSRVFSTWHREFSRKMGIVLVVVGGVTLIVGVVLTVMSLVD